MTIMVKKTGTALALVPKMKNYTYTPETKINPQLDELAMMLRYRRPDRSRTERRFIERFIKPLGVEKDAYGNLHKRIGTDPVLWSCHTDTVHWKHGMQKLGIQEDYKKIFISSHEKDSSCLGADCTAGVWLMVQMIRRKKPGLYIFHRSEEVGGIGSRFIAKRTPNVLEGIDHAIAFDRRGTGSVITHQSGKRCCSEEMANTLAKQLGGDFKGDTTGSFTDTASYTEIVPECTNLSVGYESEHSRREELDTEHLLGMVDRVMGLDISSLPVKRDPATVEWKKYSNDDFDWSGWQKRQKAFSYYPKGSLDFPKKEPKPVENDRTVEYLVKNYPDEISDWLTGYGIGYQELAQHIYDHGGPALDDDEDEDKDADPNDQLDDILNKGQ